MKPITFLIAGNEADYVPYCKGREPRAKSQGMKLNMVLVARGESQIIIMVY